MSELAANTTKIPAEVSPLGAEEASHQGFDGWLAAGIIALLALSVVMVYSASTFLALRAGDEFLYLKKQGLWVGLGLVFLSCTALIDYRTYVRFLYPMLALSFLSLVLLFAPG